MRIFWIIGLLFFAVPLEAANYYFCPQTSRYVYLGDSLDRVKQNCGQPFTSSSQKQAATQTQKIIRWTYHYQPNAAIQNGFSPNGQPNMKQNALIVDFVNDKAIRIEVEGKAVNSTTFCRPDIAFTIGSNKQFLYQSCKKPTLIQTIEKPISTSEPQKNTVLTYKNGNYNPPVRMIFTNNKLTQINE